MNTTATARCTYSTDRLEVGDWHVFSSLHELDLSEAISGILTATTTAALPHDWQGDFDRKRARQWIVQRDAESPTRLVIETETGRAIGLVILHDTPLGPGPSSPIDVRLGYVLQESAWGQGFATELVRGLIDWAKEQPSISSVSAGVAYGNEPSVHVLMKNGFTPGTTHDGEQIYELTLR